jgi:hypothetical protein
VIFRRPKPCRREPLPEILQLILQVLDSIFTILERIEKKLDNPPVPPAKPRVNFDIGPVSNRKTLTKEEYRKC